MNFYNENDPKAAAWLRALMAKGYIPNGTVDTRSISDVRGAELSGYTQCHFFAGIAGWSEALRLAGWPTGFPVWTGSCPCQPFSVAGKRKGESDERHLWPEFRRLISECRPPIIFGEQVASKAGRAWLAGVRADLEELGYAVGAADLCAAGVGAPHIRQRLYWVAYSNGTGPQGWNGAELRECAGQRAVGAGGSPGGLADAEYAERGALSIHRQDGLNGQDSGRQEAHGESGARSEIHGLARDTGGLADAKRDPRGQGRPSGRPPEGASASGAGAPVESGRRGDAGGMGNITSDGRQQRRPESDGWSTDGTGAWNNSRIIQCLDGKSRRIPIEPEFFPLAHGVPGRVGLLRGYGNAIVPQVAAEFIKAATEAIASI